MESNQRLKQQGSKGPSTPTNAASIIGLEGMTLRNVGPLRIDWNKCSSQGNYLFLTLLRSPTTIRIHCEIMKAFLQSIVVPKTTWTLSKYIQSIGAPQLKVCLLIE